MIEVILLGAAAALQVQPILTIDPSHRIVEGIASDGNTIWVSSIFDRKVLACQTGAGTHCRTLLTLPVGLGPFGMAWDATRERLWIGADCPPNSSGKPSCDRGAIFAVDRKGRIKTRIATTSGPFHPGDVSASAAGVFVSDSQNGAVYRLSSKGSGLDTLLAPGVGKSGQGSTVSADGKTLMLADYSKGVAAIDLADGSRTLLPRAGDKPLRGIDGLVRCGSTYYGVYNGATPGTIIAITRNGNEIAIDQPLGEVTLPDPTQLALVGDRLLVVADAGWAAMEKKDFVRTQGAVISAIDLPGGCNTQ